MTAPAELRTACCHDREAGWLLDDIVTAGVYGGMIPTAVLDQLPPSRALLYVRLALESSARLEHGTLDDLVHAARHAVGNSAGSRPGWWSRWLDRPPVRVPRPTNAAPAAARLT
jgi:hypothetical protein